MRRLVLLPLMLCLAAASPATAAQIDDGDAGPLAEGRGLPDDPAELDAEIEATRQSLEEYQGDKLLMAIAEARLEALLLKRTLLESQETSGSEASGAASPPPRETEGPQTASGQGEGEGEGEPQSSAAGGWRPVPVESEENFRAEVAAVDNSARLARMYFGAGCVGGETMAYYDPDNFLLSYEDQSIPATVRVDDGRSDRQRWTIAEDQETAGLIGEDAVDFLRDLQGAQKLFLQIEEESGEVHRATFDIEGIDDVVGEIADRCGWSSGRTQVAAARTPDASPMDVQRALKQEGLYDGAIDGIVGPRTAAGLRAIQARHGLPQTGTVTPETLRVLGLAD